MFQVSLVHSVLLCLSVWVAYGVRGEWASTLCFIGWGLWLFLLHFAIDPPALCGLYLLLLGGYVLARQVTMQPRWFAGCCGGCAVLAYSLSIWHYVPIYREHQQLLAQYPAEDLQPRLAYERKMAAIDLTPASFTGGVSPAGLPATAITPNFDERDLQRQEEQFVGSDWHEWSAQHRRRALQALSQVHEGFVADFVAQPGLGVGRIRTLRVLRGRDLDPDYEISPSLKAPELISQPDQSVEQSQSADEETNRELAANLQPQPVQQLEGVPVEASAAVSGGDHSAAELEALKHLNRASIVSFAPPLSLGGVNSKLQARGFLSHAFRKPAEPLEWGDPPEIWHVQRIELVSLLKHQPAAVYVSAHLPAMDELRDAVTRPVTDFEARAIDQLRAGQEIVMHQEVRQRRMVGAIRAIQECRRCHQVPLGGLLGAFTYELQSRKALPDPPRKPKDVTLRGTSIQTLIAKH